MSSSEKAGLSPERLARIRPAVEKYVADGRFAGAVTLVARRGEIVYSDGGTIHSAGARSHDGRPIEKGAEVMVTKYEKGIAWVRRLEEVLPGVEQAVRRIESARSRPSAFGSRPSARATSVRQ